MGIWGGRKEGYDVQEVHAVQDKTAERIAKLNTLIAEENKSLEQAYREIGKKYVETCENYEPGMFISLLDRVHQATNRINWLNGYIDDLKGVLRCPKCSRTLSSDSRYCNYCGTKLNIAEYVPCPSCGAPVNSTEDRCLFCGSGLHESNNHENQVGSDTILVEMPSKRICKKCGHELKDDENFCVNCGKRYECKRKN